MSNIRLGALVLTVTSLISVSFGMAHPAPVEAAGGACLPSVRGVPLSDHQVINEGSIGDHMIYCGYLKKTRKHFIGAIHVSLQWIEAGSKVESSVDLEAWCAPSASDRERWTYPYLGERMVRAQWSATAAAGEGKWDKKALRAAEELAATVVDGSSWCGPDYATATTARPTTTIELTGDRLDDLADGGIGAIVELSPDERDALVASLGDERITDEHFGTRGRVIEIGTVASSADGDKVVSVTVELVGEPVVTPEPKPKPKPESVVTPEPKPESVVTPEPAPSAQNAAREMGEALISDLTSQLDKAAAAGGGSITVDAELIDRLAKLPVVSGKVKRVWLEDKRVVLDTELKGPVYIYPKVESSGNVSIEIRTEVFKVPIPVSMDFLSVFSQDLPRLIETVTGEVNSEVFARSLLVTGIEVTPGGISAKIEKYPG